jgi:hypothetical protein
MKFPVFSFKLAGEMEFELTIMMKEGNESNGDQTMNNELNLL